MSDDRYLTDMVQISSARYSVLFSYENVYGVFRPKADANDMNCSQSYDLIAFEYYGEAYPDDVLTDICFLIRSGSLNLRINDVVSIRFNGEPLSFRYIQVPQTLFEAKDCFRKIERFLDMEVLQYIKEIHDNNLILSVLDGKVLSIKDEAFENHRAYCVEEETYQSGKCFINNTFSVYGLFGTTVKRLDPFDRPFISLRNALYFIEKSNKKKSKPILLLNRRELDMLKDFNRLHSFPEALSV